MRQNFRRDAFPKELPLVEGRWPLEINIRLDGNGLRYGSAGLQKWRKQRFAENPPADLLAQFTLLADASAEEIEAFARNWGMLGLCRHGTTIHWHNHPDSAVCPPINPEPLKFWRNVARHFAQLLHRIEQSRSNPRTARTVAAFASHEAYSFGHLHPVAVQVGQSFVLRLAGGPLAPSGLAAALSYLLLVTVTAGKNWLICASCQKMFPNTARTRSPGRAAYCEECGLPAALRAASTRYYKKHSSVIRNRRAKRGAQARANTATPSG
jgi:hypothetical protein